MRFTQSSFQYGIAMLPVLVNAVLERRAGPSSLHRFLPFAQAQLQADIVSIRQARASVVLHSWRRTERLQVGRYYDLAQRTQKARRLALEAIAAYLERGGRHLLEEALRQFETGERFHAARVNLRISLPPLVCEGISRAS